MPAGDPWIVLVAQHLTISAQRGAGALSAIVDPRGGGGRAPRSAPGICGGSWARSPFLKLLAARSRRRKPGRGGTSAGPSAGHRPRARQSAADGEPAPRHAARTAQITSRVVRTRFHDFHHGLSGGTGVMPAPRSRAACISAECGELRHALRTVGRDPPA